MTKAVVSKVTEYEGYVSGDIECFCLSKVTFKEYWKHSMNMPLDNKDLEKWHLEHEALTLYPDLFFPEVCRKGKWHFKIIVEAERVKK